MAPADGRRLDLTTPDSSRCLDCTRCGTPLPGAALVAGRWTCGGCEALLDVWAFPALWQAPPSATPGEALSVEGEAACFYHPHKRAAVVCDGCGRYLCSLCDVLVGDAHYCPGCLETGKLKTTAASLETQRTLWDQIALSLAVLPMLVFYMTVLTAPIAIVLGIRHWKTPGSLVRRSRWRFVVAIALGALQLIGMTALIVGMVFAFKSKAPL